MKKILFLFIILGILVNINIVSALGSYSNNNNKVVYYRFNQDSGTEVINSVPGFPNGSYSAAPTWQSSTWTGFNNAARHSSVRLLNSSFIGNASLQRNFTIEFRLNPSDVEGAVKVSTRGRIDIS